MERNVWRGKEGLIKHRGTWGSPGSSQVVANEGQSRRGQPVKVKELIVRGIRGRRREEPKRIYNPGPKGDQSQWTDSRSKHHREL